MLGVLKGTIALVTTDLGVVSECTGSVPGGGAASLHISIAKQVFEADMHAQLSVQTQMGADNVNFVDVGDPVKVAEGDPDSVVADLLTPGVMWFRLLLTFTADGPTTAVFRIFATAVDATRHGVAAGDPPVFGLLGARALPKPP